MPNYETILLGLIPLMTITSHPSQLFVLSGYLITGYLGKPKEGILGDLNVTFALYPGVMSSCSLQASSSVR